MDPNNANGALLNHVWYSIIFDDDVIITKEVIVPDAVRALQKKFVTDAILDTLFEFLSRTK